MADLLLRTQSHLTERDHVLLSWLYDHGVLTTFQITVALFPSRDFAQKRLLKLVALGVVDRFRPQRPDSGSYPYHYVLDQLGADIVQAQRPGEEAVPRLQARQRRWYLTNRANLPHLLGTNQFSIDLAGCARTHPDSQLERWWSASRCVLPGTLTDGGPPVGYLPVRPGGHGIWREGDRRVAFWLGYDNATESYPRLLDKIRRYAQQFPVSAPEAAEWPVLFSLSTFARETALHERLGATYPRARVATIARDGWAGAGRSPADGPWWLHSDGRPLRRLLDLGERGAS